METNYYFPLKIQLNNHQLFILESERKRFFPFFKKDKTIFISAMDEKNKNLPDFQDYLATVQKKVLYGNGSIKLYSTDMTVEELDIFDLTWKHFVDKKNNDYFINYSLPDLPLFIKFQSQLNLLPYSKIDFYIKIPLWLGLIKDKLSNIFFYNFKVNSLSRSWFGDASDTISGCLSYTVYGKIIYRGKNSKNNSGIPFVEGTEPESTEGSENSPQRNTIWDRIKEHDFDLPFYAYSPITIINQSKDICVFSSMLIETQYYNLYSTSNYIITDRLKVNFFHRDKINKEILPPSDYDVVDSILVLQQKEKYNKSVFKKSISLFNDISRV